MSVPPVSVFWVSVFWVSVDAVDAVLAVDSVDAVLSVDAVDAVLSVVAVVSVCWLSAHSDAAVARRRARPCSRSALSLGSTLLGSCVDVGLGALDGGRRRGRSGRRRTPTRRRRCSG